MGKFINSEHASAFDDTKDIPGWQMPGDTEMLFELGYKSGDAILEIGTFGGRSAVAALKGALSAGRRPAYYGVDIDHTSIDQTRKTLERFDLLKTATLFEGDIASFVQRFCIAPTMVFVDGDHAYDGVRHDLRTLAALVTPGTPIMCHDYLNPDTPGVARAVDEWIRRGWASAVRTDGCSVLLTASSKCAPQGFLQSYWTKARAICAPRGVLRSHWTRVRSTLRIRTRLRATIRVLRP